MPPIINSNHSKITLDTRNILIDVTATDKTKLDVVVNMVVTMFSEYCQVPFQVEPVNITYPDGTSRLSPDLSSRPTTASVSYINAALGLNLAPSEMCSRLSQMGIAAQPSSSDPSEIDVQIPPTRPDVLHECDIMEDVGIAYGFNNLPKSLPVTNTVAKPFPINKLGDLLRKECAMAGWVECLPLILVSERTPFCFVFQVTCLFAHSIVPLLIQLPFFLSCSFLFFFCSAYGKRRLTLALTVLPRRKLHLAQPKGREPPCGPSSQPCLHRISSCPNLSSSWSPQNSSREQGSPTTHANL